MSWRRRTTGATLGGAAGSTGLANRTPITAVPGEIREKSFMRFRRTAEPIGALEGTILLMLEASAAEAVVMTREKPMSIHSSRGAPFEGVNEGVTLALEPPDMKEEAEDTGDEVADKDNEILPVGAGVPDTLALGKLAEGVALTDGGRRVVVGLPVIV